MEEKIYDKTKKFAQKYQIQQAWPTPTELFADSAIDIVYIGTPNNTHYDFIKKALLAGKHVLCEKPMVINREQFLELVNLAKEKQLILEEAYTPFHMPVMNKIKEAIDAGKIGKVCEVQANFSAAIKNPNPKGRLYNPALGGGNLLDMGCYPICFAQK